MERSGISEPVEGRQLQICAAKPSLERDVGADPGGFARCQRERLCHMFKMFDYCDFGYSIIAAARTSRKYALDFASYFSANILSRISFFLGVSTLVGSLAHSTTISMPCLVTSGGVRWPICMPSSTSRSEGGMSAEVLVTDSRIAAFGIALKKAFASVHD